MIGQNFTDRTRKVLALAREEAHRLGHEYVGTEHIVLGLIREGDGVAIAALRRIAVDPNDVRRRIEETIKSGPAPSLNPGDLPYTSRAKKSLELAMTEAREMNHKFLGTEHLLLGVLREEKGLGAQVLADAGVRLPAVRADIQALLRADDPAPPDGDHPDDLHPR